MDPVQAAATTAPPVVRRRPWRIAAIVLLLLAVALFAAWQAALNTLERRVRDALGPEATLQDLRIGWPGVVVVEQLRLKAPEGWPAPEALRAERIEVVPALRSLLSERMVVEAVKVEGAYLSVRRSRDGKLELLPGLVERARRNREDRDGASEDAGRALTLDRIDFDDASIDFHDASVGREPVRLHLADVAASFEDLKLPELDARSALSLEGRIRSRRKEQPDGEAAVKGWLQVATRESDLHLSLRDVDLLALEPYLIKRSEVGVQRGRLSLDMKSRVRERQLHAPGEMTLADLQLKSGGGLTGTFMGMPRKAVIASLKSGGDRIRLSFVLEGDLDNTRFSLNETLATRVAVGMAQTLGVGLVDFVKDIGSFGGDALEATGDAIGNLFGKGRSSDEGKGEEKP